MGDYYRMIKYKASQRRIDTFDIGNGFTLMNIIMKNEEGKMKSIDTYIGVDRNGFNCVGHTEGLDQTGTLFRYADYVRMIDANIDTYLEIFYNNISQYEDLGKI